jgi:hypothetical protein
MSVTNIVSEIKAGKLTRDLDESGAGGFWDLAGEIATTVYPGGFYDKVAGPGFETLQVQLYNQFWQIYEEATA